MNDECRKRKERGEVYDGQKMKKKKVDIEPKEKEEDPSSRVLVRIPIESGLGGMQMSSTLELFLSFLSISFASEDGKKLDPWENEEEYEKFKNELVDGECKGSTLRYHVVLSRLYTERRSYLSLEEQCKPITLSEVRETIILLSHDYPEFMSLSCGELRKCEVFFVLRRIEERNGCVCECNCGAVINEQVRFTYAYKRLLDLQTSITNENKKLGFYFLWNQLTSVNRLPPYTRFRGVEISSLNGEVEFVFGDINDSVGLGIKGASP